MQARTRRWGAGTAKGHQVRVFPGLVRLVPPRARAAHREWVGWGGWGGA